MKSFESALLFLRGRVPHISEGINKSLYVETYKGTCLVILKRNLVVVPETIHTDGEVKDEFTTGHTKFAERTIIADIWMGIQMSGWLKAAFRSRFEVRNESSDRSAELPALAALKDAC